MKRRAILWKVLAGLAFLPLFTAGCAGPPKQREIAIDTIREEPVRRVDDRVAEGFRADTSCSDVKLRTGVVTLNWRATERGIADQRLDVTVFKGGFKEGHYNLVYPLRGDSKFQAARRDKEAERSAHLLGGLRVNKVESTRNADGVSVEIEGLEPGLTYYWRVLNRSRQGWVPGRTIRCRGPVCPADMKKAE